MAFTASCATPLVSQTVRDAQPVATILGPIEREFVVRFHLLVGSEAVAGTASASNYGGAGVGCNQSGRQETANLFITGGKGYAA